MERCNTCVLPKVDKFNFQDGKCGLCRAVEDINKEDRALDLRIQDDAKKELDAKIERIKKEGEGKPYDCLIGLSGGRDSSYLLYIMVKKHQLRCLAAYYKTPFTPPQTDTNVKHITKLLDVPLVEMDISGESHQKVARTFALQWLKKPNQITINMMCAVCKFVNREIFKIAEKHGITNIVFGSNALEVTQIAAGMSETASGKADGSAAKMLDLGPQIKKMFMLMQRGLSVLFSSVDFIRHLPLGVQSSIMYICPHTPYLKMRYPKIKMIEYFFFSDWNEKEIQRALEEMGWKLPPGCNSYWKSDCTLAEIKNYMFKETLGVNYSDTFFSNMVRNGILTREEALNRMEKEGRMSQQRFDDACKTMNLESGIFLKK